MDNIKAAAAGKRTPPDWWRELRKRERELERAQQTAKSEIFASEDSEHFEDFLRGEAREAFERVMRRLVEDLRKGGQSEPQARSNAEYVARMQMRARFNRHRQQNGGAVPYGD